MKVKIALALALTTIQAWAQQPEVKLKLSEDGQEYIKFNLTSQVWLREANNNPGSTLFGIENKSGFDVGLRRVRLQSFGLIKPKTFLYTQFGINNFNAAGSRKPGLFFHDVALEYQFRRSMHVGAGLSGWGGFARFSSPSVLSILGADAPLFQQSTNDASDQFLRKLGVYAKGKLLKLDYRVMLASPMSVQNSSAVKSINTYSDFSYNPPKPQASAYLMWQFEDEESNLTPYTTGTYLGKKKVFNLGAGFQFQRNAMWHWKDASSKDTVFENLRNLAIDLYVDHPSGKNGAAWNIYAMVGKMNYGKNYIRNNAPLNTSDGVASGSSNGSGPGTAFPMYGTGSVVYLQGGYLLPEKLSLIGGRIMPFAQLMSARYDRLNNRMNVWDIGCNYFLNGHQHKLSLNYQNRPVFNNQSWKEETRKGMLILQWQMAI